MGWLTDIGTYGSAIVRYLSATSVALTLIALTACDGLTPIAEETAGPVTEAVVTPEAVDAAATAKSSGTVIYEGGSLGVEVPAVLKHYYLPTGSLVLSGSLIEPASTGKTSGASFGVSPEDETNFSGKTITIKVVSSSAQAGEAFLAYSTNEVGNSGWLAFPVNTDESIASVTYNVPTMSEGMGDFIGIDPNGNEIVIKAIVIEVQG